MTPKIENFQQLLDQIGQVSENSDRVSLSIVIEAVGNRSFGSLLVMAGVLLVSPLSGIPGMPTIMGIFLLLIAVQLLFRRKHFWLPRWLMKRSVAGPKLYKAVNWLRPPARFIDRWLRPRLTVFISGMCLYLIVITCLAIAVSLPVMELLPFSASTAGAVLTLFGLSLVAHDGFIGLLAFALMIIVLGLFFYNVF